MPIHSLIKIPEDYQFLQDQQNAWKIIMVGEHIVFKINVDKEIKAETHRDSEAGES